MKDPLTNSRKRREGFKKKKVKEKKKQKEQEREIKTQIPILKRNLQSFWLFHRNFITFDEVLKGEMHKWVAPTATRSAAISVSPF